MLLKFRESRKIEVETPTAAPIRLATINHLKTLIKSMDSSVMDLFISQISKYYLFSVFSPSGYDIIPQMPFNSMAIAVAMIKMHLYVR